MNEIDLSRIDLNLLVVFKVLMERRSVTAAAEKLGRTQSAVSHSLARLRDQLGDPLLVRVGGRMQPSPFAEQLVEDISPLLRGMRRVLAPPQLFDPATSDRVFRIAMPTLSSLIADVSMRVSQQAPGVRIEWMPAHHEVYDALSEGQIDLAHLGGEPRLPDGLEHQVMEPFSWVTFARQDHPAIQNWGLDAWHTYPHLMVTDSSAVAPILARSDFLATFPAILLAGEMEAHGLCALKPIIKLDSVLVRFFWSSRLANDAGSIWIRSIVIETYKILQAEAEMELREERLVAAR